jgi:hypothetical protein
LYIKKKKYLNNNLFFLFYQKKKKLKLINLEDKFSKESKGSVEEDEELNNKGRKELPKTKETENT